MTDQERETMEREVVSYATGHHRILFPDIYEMKAFKAGWTTCLARSPEVLRLRAEVEKLKTALAEFDNDDNWLLEGRYADRPVRTKGSDRVYIGKWDPRVFATHAIKGDPLPNTKPEERQELSEFYTPDARLTEKCNEVRKLQAENTALRKVIEEMHLACAPNTRGSCPRNAASNVLNIYFDKYCLIDKSQFNWKPTNNSGEGAE